MATKSKASTKTAAASKVPSKVTSKAETSKIGKTQLVEQLAHKTGMSKKDAGAAVSALSELMVDALKSGTTLGMPGVGTFSVAQTAERQGVRPGTSDKITIPAGKKVRFKVASTLKNGL